MRRLSKAWLAGVLYGTAKAKYGSRIGGIFALLAFYPFFLIAMRLLEEEIRDHR